MARTNKKYQKQIESIVKKYVGIGHQCKLSKSTFISLLKIIYMYDYCYLNDDDIKKQFTSYDSYLTTRVEQWNLIDTIITLISCLIAGGDDKDNDDTCEFVYNLIMYYIADTEYGKYIGRAGDTYNNVNFTYEINNANELYDVIQNVIALHVFKELSIMDILLIFNKHLPYKNTIYLQFNNLSTIDDVLSSDMQVKYIFVHDNFTNDMQANWNNKWKQINKDLNMSKRFSNFKLQCIHTTYDKLQNNKSQLIELNEFLSK